jgi:hypothetical protein
VVSFFSLFVTFYNCYRYSQSYYNIYPFIPTFSQKHSIILGLIVFFTVGIIVLYGHIQALNTQIVHLPITIHKKIEGSQKIRILMASDLHLVLL